MGTFERVNRFYGVGHQQVYAALEEFWHQEEHTLELEDVHDVNLDSYALHERCGDWTVLKWTRGWEWDLRRRAQLHVSRAYWAFQNFLGVGHAPVWRRFTTSAQATTSTDK